MFWRAVRSLAIVAAAVVVVTYLPDAARYFRMRDM